MKRNKMELVDLPARDSCNGCSSVSFIQTATPNNKPSAVFAGPAGIVVYNSFLKTVRLRQLMLWGSLLGCALGLTPLMLVEGVNRKLGISDKVFALVDSALLSSIGQVRAMRRPLTGSCTTAAYYVC